jgi:hypothetical protein
LYELEVLYGVGNVYRTQIDTGRRDAFVQYAPGGPTNGRPSRSSLSPGCSPTNINLARAGPWPKTVCVACAYKSQPWQSAAATRKLFSESRSGKNAAAGSFVVIAMDRP